jgi:hypothetical protein
MVKELPSFLRVSWYLPRRPGFVERVPACETLATQSGTSILCYGSRTVSTIGMLRKLRLLPFGEGTRGLREDAHFLHST